MVGWCIVFLKDLNTVFEGQAHELHAVFEGPEHPDRKLHAYFRGFKDAAWRTLIYTYRRTFIIYKIHFVRLWYISTITYRHCGTHKLAENGPERDRVTDLNECLWRTPLHWTELRPSGACAIACSPLLCGMESHSHVILQILYSDSNQTLMKTICTAHYLCFDAVFQQFRLCVSNYIIYPSNTWIQLQMFYIPPVIIWNTTILDLTKQTGVIFHLKYLKFV